MKITVIYDSYSGHTKEMAHEIVEGAKAFGGIEVVLKHVDDAVGEDFFSEGLIIGSPTYCGLMSWKLKEFFDKSQPVAWGKVDGRIGAAFSSSGGLGGGNEMTVFSILNALMNYGFIVFGLPEYAGRGVTAHYGAVSVGSPKELERKACRMLGYKMAEYVNRMYTRN